MSGPPAGTLPPALELAAVTKRYGRQRALDGVSLVLEAGTFTLAAGPNGAGKSTLLRVVAALTRPSQGSLSVLGADPFGKRAALVREQIGYLGTQPGLYADLTVEENLLFTAQLRGVPRHRVADALGEFELERVARRRAGELSLGYEKRAGLARALLGSPRLLLLDEPWSGLDAAAARRLRFFLGRARETGATALIAAHAVKDVLGLFDAVLRLEAGRVQSLEAAHESDAESF